MNIKEASIQRIQECTSPVYIRYGWGWKGAEWYKTSKERLIDVLNCGDYAHYEFCTVNDGLGVSFYSANDML